MKNKRALWILITIASVLAWLTSIVLWISLPHERTLNIATTVFALGTLIISVLQRKEEFKEFCLSSRFKNVSTNLFSALLVACILGLINYLAYKNPYQWDVTQDQANSLTQQSRQVLANIDEAVVANIFAPKSAQGALVRMLELYQLEKKNIEIRRIDPELRPDLVKEYEVTKPVMVVWEKQGKRQPVSELNELGLTNGLIRLGRDRLPKIYYDIGHGEASLSSNEPTGRSLLQKYLVDANFALQETDTKRWEKVPADADVVMLWGPRLGFLPTEIAVFRSYLENGGKLFVALDPDLNNDPVKELRQLLVEFGVIASNVLVIDTLNHVSGSNGTVPIGSRFEQEHVISRDFPGQVFFPLAGFVTLGEQADGKALVYSSPFPASWGETTAQEFATGKVAYTEGQDTKGPLAFAVAVKAPHNSSIVFFANSTFVDNAYAKYAANHVLMLNSLSWLTGDDQLISFDLPTIETQPVFMTSAQLGTIFFFSVIIAPLGLFGLAIWNYRRRRVK